MGFTPFQKKMAPMQPEAPAMKPMVKKTAVREAVIAKLKGGK